MWPSSRVCLCFHCAGMFCIFFLLNSRLHTAWSDFCFYYMVLLVRMMHLSMLCENPTDCLTLQRSCIAEISSLKCHWSILQISHQIHFWGQNGHSHWMHSECAVLLESHDQRGPAVIKEFTHEELTCWSVVVVKSFVLPPRWTALCLIKYLIT